MAAPVKQENGSSSSSSSSSRPRENGDHASSTRPAKRVKSEDDHDEDAELLRSARLLDGDDNGDDHGHHANGNSKESDKRAKQEQEESDAKRRKQQQKREEEEDDQVHQQRAAKLKFLLQRSGVYSQIMSDKMEKERKARIATAEAAEKESQSQSQAAAGNNKATTTATTGRSTRAGDAQDKQQQASSSSARPKRANAAKRKKEEDDFQVSNYISKEDLKSNGKSASPSGSSTPRSAGHSRQPALVTGAELRPYQLEGFEWLVSLYENGLNGILADEMGLGKTLQTISFLAHLRGKGVWGPFIIVAPLSTIANWVNEFERFTPGIPAMMYHAQNKDERAKLRKHFRYPTNAEEKKKFPVIVTSFEIAMMDRVHLNHLKWKYIVVDEGHRLKNMNCRLIQELKKFNSAQRLILTGTPLHNNLKELWSLLNFILPDIFDDLETFEKWFDFSDLSEEGGSNRLLNREDSKAVITQLHAILKPFLLRRLKTDVESTLPPKKEYLLYAPLTTYQKELYESCVHGTIRKWLLERKTGLKLGEIQKLLDEEGGASAGSDLKAWMSLDVDLLAEDDDNHGKKGTSNGDTQTSRGGRKRKAARNVNYEEEESEARFLKRMEDSDDVDDDDDGEDHLPVMVSGSEQERQGKLYAIRQAQKEINNMKLQNVFMQLRKICCHPYLFDWPREPDGSQKVDKGVITASGKMLLLNRLLDALFAKKHKVLIFSQFTTILDIIEAWAEEYKSIRTCRIDGTTSQEERRAQMKSFNEDNSDDSVRLFLLSTRAGGLGINLVAADTVIFYDSDWNPQMDLQAQDRVHRIGQEKPVLIFRLVSANTVESRLLKRAGDKRKLEAIVIKKGAFKLPSSSNTASLSSLGSGGSMAEVAKNILALESEKIQLASESDEIISDSQLEVLLDRSPETYASRQIGWNAHHGDGDQKGENVGFEVTETNVDGANEDLAKLMGD
ncbi:unnamed protein product [Sympodiomycopsis kandeliae]